MSPPDDSASDEFDVGAWLDGLGLGQYAEAFRENDVTPDLLPKLTDEDLLELGVIDESCRTGLLAASATLNAPPQSPAPATQAPPVSRPPAKPLARPQKPASVRPPSRVPLRPAQEPPIIVPPVSAELPAAAPTWAYAAITGLLLVIVALLVGGYFLWQKAQPKKPSAAPAKPAASLIKVAAPAGQPVPVAAPKPGRHILVQWDFEGAKPIHSVSIEGEPPKVVADPLNPKNKVMLSILKPEQARAERSEVRTQHSVGVGEERWVGVRILRPEPVQTGFTCFFQLGPISGAKGLGGAGLYQLAAYGKDGSYQWRIRGFVERLGAKPVSIDVGPVAYGKWEDWVFHMKLRADSSGLLEVWRDGKLVATHHGQNAQPGDHIPIKWGVYVGKGSAVPKDIRTFYDEVTIGDADSSYAEVAPKHAAGKP